MKAFLREILITAVLAVVVFITIQATIQTFVVVGSSMEPSFWNGQRLIVSKAAYAFHQPEMGDVIVFQPPNGQHEDYIKRIIGLPGDTIEIKGGAVYVNGAKLSEPYIKDAPNYTLPHQKVLENSYFVLGDNRDNSNDSHNGWMVPRKNIVGKAWLSIWPPGEWGLAPNYPQKQLVASATLK